VGGYGASVAAGRGGGRLGVVLGIVGVLALVVSYVLITGFNPVPGTLDWLDRMRSVSQPETVWQVRLGGRPEVAVPAGPAVVVLMRGRVEVRDLRTGGEMWTRDVSWAAVAGADAGAVVVAGRAGRRGYEVVDPTSGAVRWTDEHAVGVWTYRDVVLALTCQGLAECALAARDPLGGDVRWRTALPGVGKVLAGANHELLGSRELVPAGLDARMAGPVEAPPMLGFPLGGKVQVVELASGRRVREAEAGGTTRVVVVAGRLLYSTAQRQQGQCRYTLEARDPRTGGVVWRKAGYDLGTASGAGCEQRRDPAGGGGALAAVRGDNREVLLNAYDGRELWVGAPGERALATDGLVALVRSGDGRAVRAVDLGGGGDLWRREVSPEAEASLTRHAAVFVDGEAGRVVAVEAGSGRLLVDARTSASLVGVGPDGLVLAAGRNLGLLTHGSIAS